MPFLLMGLKPGGSGGAYQLNCSVIPNLDAHQSRTYNVVLDVPASAAGDVQLGWSLAG